MIDNTNIRFWPVWADLLIIFTLALITASIVLTISITAYGSYRNGTDYGHEPVYGTEVPTQ